MNLQHNPPEVNKDTSAHPNQNKPQKEQYPTHIGEWMIVVTPEDTPVRCDDLIYRGS